MRKGSKTKERSTSTSAATGRGWFAGSRPARLAARARAGASSKRSRAQTAAAANRTSTSTRLKSSLSDISSRRIAPMMTTGSARYTARAHTGSVAAAACACSLRRGRRNQSSITASNVTGPASQASRVKICDSMLGSLFAADLEHGQEGFLRNLHGADLFHALLAGLLLLEKFP